MSSPSLIMLMNAGKIPFVAQQTIPINPSLARDEENSLEKGATQKKSLLSSKKHTQKKTLKKHSAPTCKAFFSQEHYVNSFN